MNSNPCSLSLPWRLEIRTYKVPSLNKIISGKILRNLILEKKKAQAAVESSLKAIAHDSATQTTSTLSRYSTP